MERVFANSEGSVNLAAPAIAVIGIGNILFCDDGAGVYAAGVLEHNYAFSPPVDIIDGGTLGFKLLDILGDYERVIIIDTISVDDPAGTVFVMPGSQLCDIGSLRQTAHEVEVVEMLKMAELFDDAAEVTVVGIVPEDTQTVEFALTLPVKKNFELLIAQTVKQLSAWEVLVTPRDNVTSVDDLLYRYRKSRLA